jgi:uncharacterized protein (DUF2267 family)
VQLCAVRPEPLGASGVREGPPRGKGQVAADPSPAGSVATHCMTVQINKEDRLQTEEMDTLIQNRAGLDSAEQAHQAGTAVLSELGRLDIGSEGRDVAAQLPAGYKEALAGESGSAEPVTKDEFLSRVESALEMDREAAAQVAHAAISTAADAVTPGERVSFVNALPSEISSLAAWS